MKTRNNVQKAVKKSLAIVASLVLISFTVNAQDFWKSILESETLNEFAVIMVTHNNVPSTASKSKAANANAFAPYMVDDTEEELSLEDWMKNENLFKASASESEAKSADNTIAKFAEFTANQETEEAMELEDWMTDNSKFDVKPIKTDNEVIPASTDNFQHRNNNNLGLEAWMVTGSYWR
jgi:hypothetical protein